MPRLNQPSLKQVQFVKKLVEIGKPTEAVMQSFDVTKRKNAASLAHQLLEQPQVQELLQKALFKAGATLEQIVNNVAGIANETDIRPSADTVLKANEHLLRLYNAYPERVQKIQSFNIKTNLTEKSFQDLIDLHKQKSSEIEEILNS